MIKITCLGGVQVELDDGTQASFDTDKARALLVYLAVEGKPQRRSHLAGLLWSDQSEEQALHNLRQTLSTLRKGLKENAAAPLILADRDAVQINPQVELWVDAACFQAHLDQAFRHFQKHNGRGWLNIRSLKKAMAIYQEPFLEQMSLRGSPLFDEWASLNREAFNRQAVEGLALLSEYYERRGEYASARQALLRLVELAPWEESAQAQVMRLYALDQQWSAAQNQYRILRRNLDEHLGVEPTRETAELFETIRSAAANHQSFSPRFPVWPVQLPVSQTPFVGREKELDDLIERIVDPECRLVTLLGPGGIGKTRLALEAAGQLAGIFPEGVFFIPLAAVFSADQIVPAIADALGLVATDVSNLPSRLLDYLRSKHCLLVMDNFEQLAGAENAPQFLVDILRNAPGVILMITSRERLNLEEEWVFRLDGLAYPDEGELSVEKAAGYDAMALFQRRARQVNHRFDLNPATLPAVGRICKLMEGLPLGIELAAAALWSRSCDEIAAMISQDIHMLVSTRTNIEPRHRSLRGAFDISWHLLTADEQRGFASISVFRGGFTPAAALEVAEVTQEQLDTLVFKSLLDRDASGRYRLNEIIRQYAADRGEAENILQAVSLRHNAYYADLAAGHGPALNGLAQKEALADISLEIENIKAAWDGCLARCDAKAILKMAEPLYQFMNIRSRFTEGMALFRQALNALEGARHAEKVKIVLLSRLGGLAYFARETDLAQQAMEESLSLAHQLEDEEEAAFCRIILGGTYLRKKRFEDAMHCGWQNLAYYEKTGNGVGQTRALYLLGYVQSRLGNFSDAKTYLSRAVELGRTTENPRRLMAPLNVLGDILITEGQYEKGEACFVEGLEIARALGDLFYQAILVNNLASAYHITERYPLAKAKYQESMAICQKIGDRDGEAIALNNLGELATYQGEYQLALAYSEPALKLAREVGEEWTIIICLNNLGEACCGLGQASRSLDYFREAADLALGIGAMDNAVRIAVNAARTFQLMGRCDETVTLLQAALAHSAIEYEFKEKASRWLAECKGAVPADKNDELLPAALKRCLASGA